MQSRVRRCLVGLLDDEHELGGEEYRKLFQKRSGEV